MAGVQQDWEETKLPLATWGLRPGRRTNPLPTLRQQPVLPQTQRPLFRSVFGGGRGAAHGTCELAWGPPSWATWCPEGQSGHLCLLHNHRGTWGAQTSTLTSV